MGLGGCKSLSVNTEKDNSTVIATISGKDVIKKGYTDFLTFNYILYQIKGETLPSTDDDIKSFKQTYFNEYINYLLYKNEMQEAGKTADDVKVETAVDELMAEAKTAYPAQTDYDNLFSQYGTTEAEYRVNAFEQLRLIEYYNLYADNENDYTAVTAAPAVTVDGKEVPMYVFYYYAITLELSNYANDAESLPQTEEDFYKLYDDSITNAAQAQSYIAYAEANNITVTDEEIESAMNYVNSIEGYVGEESMDYLKESYYFTDEQWTNAKKFMGKALAVQTKIGEEVTASIQPTDKELEKYYKDNKKSFNESKISGYHILTKDKTVAQKLTDEAGGTVEGYMAVYEKYKDDATVEQAMDLGEFQESGYDEDFWAAAASMKVGEVKGMVKTQFGYHLIYVYASNIVAVPEFEDIKEEVKTAYIDSVKDQKTSDKLTKIYRAAKVKKGDYKKLPSNALVDNLHEKYDVKTYEKRAIR